MRIGTKLLSGFGVVVALLTALGATSVIEVNAVNDGYSKKPSRTSTVSSGK